MPRRYCQNCFKPEAACVCRWVSPQDSCLPVLILRHPDEAQHAIGTARLVELGLKRAHVETALKVTRERFAALLEQWSVSKPILLYPKALSPDVPHFTLDFETEHFTPPSLLNAYDSIILLDGTWRNTRELLLNNVWLKALPTLAINLAEQSRYRIRLAGQESALATIEAVSRVLSVFDDQFQPESLLRPFEKMIDYQIDRMGREIYQKNYAPEQELDD